MPEYTNLHLAPLVGALMNAARQEEDPIHAERRLRADVRYRDYTDEEFIFARAQATRNQNALLALQVVRPQLTAEQAFPTRVGPTTLIGYRVAIVIEGPGGAEQTKQVTVNAPARDPVSSILRRARDFIFTELARQHGGWAYPIVIMVDERGQERVDIFAVVEGGFPRPALGPPQIPLTRGR